jgi:hypothetical protein
MTICLMTGWLCGGVFDDAIAGFDEGRAAFLRGDYRTALHELYEPAQSGDAKSAVGMGLLYAHGLGIAQNFVVAYRWFDRAATQEPSPHIVIRTLAAENRDFLASRMSVEQLAEARASDVVPVLLGRVEYADWPDGSPPEDDVGIVAQQHDPASQNPQLGRAD